MTDVAGVVAEILRSVEARQAQGDYDRLDWLDAEIDVSLEADTPVDAYLQAGRPPAPWGSADGGRLDHARRKAMRRVAPSLPSWDARSRAVDALLRDAIGWLRLSLQSEQWAREERDTIIGGALGRLEHALALHEEALALHEEALALHEEALAPHEEATRVKFTAFETRLRALEVDRAVRHAEARPAPSEGSATPVPTEPVDFDYLGFEDRFRGHEDVIRERLQHHVPRFIQHEPVLDLGCGRGEFLQLLQASGITGRGVDSDAHMAEVARSNGLDVQTENLFAVLERTPPESLGAISAFHVIEHMDLTHQLRLIRLARAALRPGGLLLLEMPNPMSLTAGSINFLRDPTHVRPLHPETLAFLMESEGFATAEIEPLALVPPEHGVPLITIPSATTDEINAALSTIDSLLFGYQDVAVIGTR